LRALARYTSQALQRAAFLADRRSAAQVLQESLLTTLPTVDHLQIRARYVPAATGEHVGGDWYDAIVLPHGATALIIGDVTGHDLAAAAQMGQLRGLLRAFAYDRREPPTEIFSRLEKSLPALGVSTLATAVLANVEPPTDELGWRLRWTNAGHPPPLLVHPDGSTEALITQPDLLLGLVPGTARHDHTHDLPPGSTVLLYTDGLIEHRGRTLDQGLHELRATLAGVAHLPLDDLLDVLVDDLIGEHPEDDCAVIALRLQA
jgi:serine phosphatase RsbU (regulator of sigma subunit)